MKPLAIINPRSCGGKTAARIRELEQAIRRAVGSVDVALTERQRHATELAHAAAGHGRPAVIAVGGDGTVHEVVNGLMQARADDPTRKTTMGIIGQGTGGDFRKTLGLEASLDAYCHAIGAGKTRAVDVGRFSYRNDDGERDEAYFINILSVGMGGLVDRYVARASRALGGTVAYMGASIRGLIESQVSVLDCTLYHCGRPRRLELSSRSVAICNGRFFGGGMEVAPMAEPDDGRFHVVSMGDAGRLRFALSALAIYTGSHVRNPNVQVFCCERIDVELRNQEIRDRFPLDVDGEPFGLLPIRVDILPAALEVFVPDR